MMPRRRATAIASSTSATARSLPRKSWNNGKIMLSVYRTLSLRYLGRRWVRALLIVASIAVGVATLVATRALNQTMSTAGLAMVNPMPGVVDLLISNGEGTISADLAKTLARVPGVQEASPRIFDKIKLPDLAGRSVLVMG